MEKRLNNEIEKDYLNLLDDYGLPIPVIGVEHNSINKLENLLNGNLSDLEFEYFSNMRKEWEQLKKSDKKGYEEEILKSSTIGFMKSWILDFMNEFDLSMALLENVHIGEFPTNSFNAEAKKSNNGTLILVNKGLRLFLWNISKAVIAPYAKHEYTEIGLDYSTTKVVEICFQYLENRNHQFPISEFDIIDRKISKAIVSLSLSMRNFILAHEIGHIKLGHTTGTNSIKINTHVGKMNVEKCSHKMEFEADSFAQNLIINKCLKNQKFSTVGGGMYYFMIHRILSLVKFKMGLSKKVEPTFSNHPSSLKRMRKIERMLNDKLTEKQLLVSNLMINLLNEIYHKIYNGQIIRNQNMVYFAFE